MSTDKQENSIASQERVLREYAAKNGYKITDSYIDEGLSGRVAEKRPAFMRMVENSGKDLFDTVLVYDSSRFARNLEESIVYKSMLKRNGVALVSITEPTLDDDSALITDAMLGALNEMHSRKLSKAVKRGMVDKARQGKFQTPPPFGYTKENGKLIPIPEEAKTIRLLFSLFVEAQSWYGVAVKLNDMRAAKRNAYGWYARDVKRILHNPVYIGNLRYDGEVYKGEHEPIVDMEMWGEVQSIIEKKPKSKTRPASTYKHWLSGMMRCAYCGGKMHHIIDRRSNAFYRCCSNTNGCCKYMNCLGIRKLESAVKQALEMVVEDKNLAVYAHFTKRKENDQLDTLNASLKKIQAKLERHKAAYSSGVDTLEEYKENKEKCIKDEKAVLEQINALLDTNVNDEKIIQLKQSAKNLIDILFFTEQTIEQKSNAIKAVIDKIVLDKYKGTFDLYYFL